MSKRYVVSEKVDHACCYNFSVRDSKNKAKFAEEGTLICECIGKRETAEMICKALNAQEGKNNMTVKQLIEELQKLDPALQVLKPGYETGYNLVHAPSAVKVLIKNQYPDVYDGDYEIYDPEIHGKNVVTFKGIII